MFAALFAQVSVLAQVTQVPFDRPVIDWHAVAPELLLLGTGAIVTIVDLIGLEKVRRIIPTLTSFTFLISLIPVITLWNDGNTRVMFDGAWVVDEYALVLKAMFLLTGYVVVLMSTNYMLEGDYYDSEYYQLMSAAIVGMLVMTSARDLVSIFVAIELVSIPAYLLAAWRKRDLKSNEAGLKYMLMGVFASSLMLYGMSLLYGLSNSTKLTDIGAAITTGESVPAITLAIVFTVIGFGFKVSAVPFHSWAPDTYEGAPTPLTAFLAVASKAAGFVALMSIIVFAFPGQSRVVEPLLWVFSALTMTVGNLIAMRQTNIVRMLAYSGIAQAGFMLAPLAVFGDRPEQASSAIVTYLVIYAAMNLGAFAVIISVARKTRSGEISSFGGLFNYAPGLTAIMTAFLFSLAGIPPVGGWWAKFEIFRVLTDGGNFWGIALAVIGAVNSVIGAYYYLNIAKQMWFMPVPDGDESPVELTPTLQVALGLTLVFTIAAGTVLLGPLSDVTNFNFALAG